MNDKPKRKKLFRHVRRQRLNYIVILPSLITLLNGVCGFAAIGFTSRALTQNVEYFTFRNLQLPYFALAGYMIFMAMIADMLDGRLARMSHTTSSFGGQLDSLCDMVSFGVAPAFLVLKLLEFKLNSVITVHDIMAGFFGRFIWFAAAIYVACTAIRLARFNVENEEDETAHMSFMGLPTPAAAGVLAGLVVFYEDLAVAIGESSTAFAVIEKIIVYTLPFIVIGIAILMISRIRYPHLVNQYLKGKKPLTHLLWVVGIVGLIWLLNFPSALAVSFCGFALTGFVRYLYYHIIISRHHLGPDLQSKAVPNSDDLAV